jgi:hypothetical protein
MTNTMAHIENGVKNGASTREEADKLYKELDYPLPGKL